MTEVIILSQFLFVGSTTDREGATTRIKVGGGTYRKKLLSSNPENWEVIAGMVRGSDIKGVLVTLTGDDYGRILSTRYRATAENMFAAFASVPHIVFVHESVFFDPEVVTTRERTTDQVPPADDWDDPWEEDEDEDESYMSYLISQFREVDTETRAQVNALLVGYGLNVMPYKTNAERAVMASSFIEDNDRALLFRVYVPAGRLYADEADRLLDLFQEWLGATGRAAIRRDGYRTGAGQVYEFFGTQPAGGGELERQFADFSSFLDLCVSDAISATTALEKAGMTHQHAAAMATRLAKEARRLSLDLRHARQNRIMQLSQLFENELLDAADADWKPLLETLIPAPRSVIQAIEPHVRAADAAASVYVDNITITQQVFSGNVSQVVQSVEGTVHMNPDAKQLLDIIAQYGGERVNELTTAVHELEDEDARASDRLTARQRLRAFLVSVATEIPTMTMQTLQKYVEHRLGLG